MTGRLEAPKTAFVPMFGVAGDGSDAMCRRSGLRVSALVGLGEAGRWLSDEVGGPEDFRDLLVSSEDMLLLRVVPFESDDSCELDDVPRCVVRSSDREGACTPDSGLTTNGVRCSCGRSADSVI